MLKLIYASPDMLGFCFLDTQYLYCHSQVRNNAFMSGISVFGNISCLRFISPFGRFYEELRQKSSLSLIFSLSIPLLFTSLSLSLISLSLYLSPSLSLPSSFLSGVSNGRFRPCYCYYYGIVYQYYIF